MVRVETVVLGGASHKSSLAPFPSRLVETVTPGEKLIMVRLWYLDITESH